MSDDNQGDHIADCADSLHRIAESLERISHLLDRCMYVLDYSGDETRYAIRTIPLTD